MFWRQLKTEKHSAILLFIGFLILGITDNLILLIEKEASLWQFHFYRSLFAIPLLLFISQISRTSIKPQKLKFVLFRTSLITIALLLYFGSLTIMPLAIAACGLFTSPIFVLIFSSVFFGHRVSAKHIVTILMGAMGVWLILEPTAPSFSFSYLIPVFAGAIYALNNIATHHFCSEESPLCLVTFFYSSLGLCGLFGATAFCWKIRHDGSLSKSIFTHC